MENQKANKQMNQQGNQEESNYRMLSVPDALALVLEQCGPLPVKEVPPSEALGMTLAVDVVAKEPLPPFPASMKDGYAVMAESINAGGEPGEYPLVGEVRAGRMADFELAPGEVAYITTGAPLPWGADAVVMVEETERVERDGATWVRIHGPVQIDADVRPVGVDVAPGQAVLTSGDMLGPAELGILATVGASRVSVYRRPVVAVLSTGDELVEPGTPLAAGQIRDSNRTTLLAAIETLGGTPLDLGIAGDELGALAVAIEQGLAQADILLTSGGVSMGDSDFVKPLLERKGQVHFGRLCMKPGKPLTFATAPRPNGGAMTNLDVSGQCLIFGLPGNPVSSMVTFLLLVAPALRKMAGRVDPNWPTVQAELTQKLALDAYRPEFHRATLRWDREAHGGRGGFIATSTGSQASSRLLSMRTANALLLLPIGEGSLPAGSVVDALMIGNL